MVSRRVLEVLAVTTCAVGIGLLNGVTHDAGPRDRIYSGPVGDPVTSPYLTLTVDEVTLADAVTDGATRLETAEVFVVVEWTVSARERPTPLRDAELHTEDGLTITERSGFYDSAVDTTAPGFTRRGFSVFQVPADDVVGADFVIGGARGVVYTHGFGLRVTDVVTGETEHVSEAVLGPATLEVTP